MSNGRVYEIMGKAKEYASIIGFSIIEGVSIMLLLYKMLGLSAVQVGVSMSVLIALAISVIVGIAVSVVGYNDMFNMSDD